MSNEGPKPYNVVYDAASGALQYSFSDAYYALPSSASGITALTGPVTASGSGSVATSITNGAIKPVMISTTSTDNFVFPGTLAASKTFSLGSVGGIATTNIGDAAPGSSADINIKSGSGQQGVLNFNQNGDKWAIINQTDGSFLIYDEVAGMVVMQLFTGGGVVVTNLSTTQKNALTNKAGMLVFDTSLGKLCVNNGSAWQTVTSV